MSPRADKTGAHRATFERNKRRILVSQQHCGICGGVVDLSLKPPHPMAPCIDHIVPISKGGHPSDIDNLQLAHWACNRQKADKLYKDVGAKNVVTGNRNLPQSCDWTAYRPDGESYTIG